ncbi:MAG: TraR/DksA family transcriptional regulator [Gammaproteobacteria bacterium]|nr:TraR/DksA family transcriptional regulator [Gammaproteobacteria bacterium]
MAKLSAEQIRYLSQMMDQRFDREMREINSVAARSATDRAQEALSGKPADLLDSALAEMMLATDYAVVQQDVQDVRDILAARKRIADGSYGTCIDCGADIGYARLEAYSTAKRCIGCQEKRERQPRR